MGDTAGDGLMPAAPAHRCCFVNIAENICKISFDWIVIIHRDPILEFFYKCRMKYLQNAF
jgi:hypothetical protein